MPEIVAVLWTGVVLGRQGSKNLPITVEIRVEKYSEEVFLGQRYRTF